MISVGNQFLLWKKLLGIYFPFITVANTQIHKIILLHVLHVDFSMIGTGIHQ